MEKENSDWEITTNRFVAFMDILGFTDRIMRNPHEAIYKDLEELNQIIKDTKNYGINDAELHVVNFSDSIVFFSKDDSIDNFHTFVGAITLSFKKILAKKIPIKVGVAYGMTSVNKEKEIFFGQPIIDAFQMEEDVNYLGIVCHHTFEQYHCKLINSDLEDRENENLPKKLMSNLFVDKITPLKSGKSVHLNLAWYKILFDTKKECTENEEIINGLKTTMSGPPRRYIDNTLEIIK